MRNRAWRTGVRVGPATTGSWPAKTGAQRMRNGAW
jgi:hypothetical protein